MGYILDLRKIEGIGHRPLQMVACAVFLFDENGKVLLQKRADDFTWCVPGGSMELGETPEEAARREFFEETGLELGDLTLYNVMSGEDSHFTYPNGDEVYAVDINFICYDYSGTIKMQEEEVLDLRFFAMNELPYNLHKNDKRVIEEVAKKAL
ncbi:MAG: NUDIX hydrolase [Lachnospiraceae bacterium]|nr:NUDIX hydrolase [Lachnospiraceae bacterium]